MAEQADFSTNFSTYRLHGDPLPHDLATLVEHRDELTRRTGIVLNSSAEWAPWLDTSYLKESDWANPGIRANVRAISEVCKLIDFIAATEDGNYLGYWRGQACFAISQAPIVGLDNEGQFNFCGTENIAGAILTMVGGFEELQPWFRSIGIESLPTGPYDLFDLDLSPSPREMHKALYEKYDLEERSA